MPSFASFPRSLLPLCLFFCLMSQYSTYLEEWNRWLSCVSIGSSIGITATTAAAFSEGVEIVTEANYAPTARWWSSCWAKQKDNIYWEGFTTNSTWSMDLSTQLPWARKIVSSRVTSDLFTLRVWTTWGAKSGGVALWLWTPLEGRYDGNKEYYEWWWSYRYRTRRR
jgi:hypothetical protein